MLSTKGHLWNKVALYLGYSPDDIQQHFSGTHRPILQILKDYTSKGGSEEEFLNIVHKVDLSSHPPNTDVKNNRTNLFNHLYGTRHIEKRGAFLPYCLCFLIRKEKIGKNFIRNVLMARKCFPYEPLILVYV